MKEDITAIAGIKVGHASNQEAGTGCSVIICEREFMTGIDVRGGGPGTRETDLLSPLAGMQRIDALLFTGGSAYGLDAASGVMEYLEENNKGYDVNFAKVPIVPAAVIFDLGYKSAKIRPDKGMGYLACQNANHATQPSGSIGAGTGATVGKIMGMENATKSGIGHSLIQLGDLLVGAMVVVNAFGDIYDYQTGQIIAGAKDDANNFVSTKNIFTTTPDLKTGFNRENTTIGAVVTNARIDKAGAAKVAGMAQDGLARTINPVHTMLDGDSIFTLAAGDIDADINQLGILAAEAVAIAIINAVQ